MATRKPIGEVGANVERYETEEVDDDDAEDDGGEASDGVEAAVIEEAGEVDRCFFGAVTHGR